VQRQTPQPERKELSLQQLMEVVKQGGRFETQSTRGEHEDETLTVSEKTSGVATAVASRPRTDPPSQRRETKSHAPMKEASSESWYGQFECGYCKEQFKSAQSLGGHVSRRHPGTSQNYNYKIQRRDERAFERKLLQLAKERHAQVYGKDAVIDRPKIRRFKKELRKQLEQ
jgi:hypothetical protein